MDQEFFDRGVEEIINEQSFKEKLAAKKPLRIKLGVDPTRPDIHLGHSVSLLRLKALQEAGHTIIFLIGDYTARIGDPSGRNKTRPILSEDEIRANAKTYLDQVGKILDINKTEIRYNSEWFSKQSFADILELAGKFSVAQILERDDFTNRLKTGSNIGLHELLYPVMQAYDSVMLKANVEVGGTDQKFNMLAGRDLQRKFGQVPQDVITFNLLVGTDGKEKMSKSLDNYVGVTELPAEQFGKIMSLPDSQIIPYFILCTAVPAAEVSSLKQELESGANPRDIKAKLAYTIAAMYHGAEAAKAAEVTFTDQFQKGILPDDLPEVQLEGTYRLPLLLVELQAVGGTTEAVRLIEQGGVKIDGAKMGDAKADITVYPGMVVQVGKRRAFRIV